MSGILATTTAAADPDAAVAVITTLAATFVAVGLYLLFKITDALAGLLVTRTVRRCRRSRRFLHLPRVGRLFWMIDIAAVVGIRTVIAFYVAVLLLFVGPIAITIGSLDLAVAIVTPR